MTKLSVYSMACASVLSLSVFTAPLVAAQTMARYQLSVTNLTSNQPLSPLAAVIHGKGYHTMQIGMPASMGLEKLAEGGDTSEFLAEARMQAGIVYETKAGSGPIPPGGSAELVLSIHADMPEPKLSFATMLVNTNDAITGLNAHSLMGLAVGDSMKLTTNAYDAGTEANTESAGTIPGPADGGEGYNPERESRDQVTAHPGVVTQADGLATSVLDESHRFLNPVTQVVITRLADEVTETTLQFVDLQAQYNPGDQLTITVAEQTEIRTAMTDLWVALLMPDDTVLFFTETGLTFEPLPFKTEVAPSQRNHPVFDLTLPTGLGGYYTLFTFYALASESGLQIQSDITQQGLRLMDN